MRQFGPRLGDLVPAGLGIALPITFFPWVADSFILPREAIVIAGSCAGLLLAIWVSRAAGLGRLRWPLVAAAATAGISFALSTSWSLSLIGSYTRYESLPTRLAYIGLLVTPAWFVRSDRWAERVGQAVVLGTTIACVEAVTQATPALFRPDGNLGNANLLGALIAMAAPLAVTNALRGRWNLLWLLTLPLLGAGLVVSTSRSGGLGVLAGLLTILVGSFSRWRALMAAAGAFLVMAAGLVVIAISPLRFLNSDPGPTRIHLWTDALRMITSRPLFGWGEDSTGLVFGRFLTGDWSPGVSFDRTHSGPLEIASTQGLAGLAALGIVWAVVGHGLWLRRSAPGIRGVLAACIGYSVWVAVNFDWVPATACAWLLAGSGWSIVQRHALMEAPVQSVGGKRFAIRSLQVVASAGAVAVLVTMAVLPLLADYWYLQGRARIAVALDPLQVQYHLAAGESLAAQGDRSGAIAELSMAAQLGSTDSRAYIELGDQERAAGRTADARAAYEQALRINPFDAEARRKLASLK